METVSDLVLWVEKYWAVFTILGSLGFGAGGAVITNRRLNKEQDKRLKALETDVKTLTKEMEDLGASAKLHYILDKQNKRAFEGHKKEMTDRFDGLQSQINDLPFKILDLIK